jgi:hypothetical protein
MISSRTSIALVIPVFSLLLSPATAISQGHSISEEEIPTSQIATLALQIANKINSATLPTPKEMLEAYYSEITIGRCVWGLSPGITDSVLIRELKMFSHLRDSTIGYDLVSYVQTHKDRFVVIDDGFKGEENYWEPNSYWLQRIKSEYPGSTEGYEIEFDLDFASLMRRYRPDPDALGKTCSEYVTQDLAQHRDSYLEVYSEDDFKQWIPQCDTIRKIFQTLKMNILQKYAFAPFTQKLQDIDSTTIVPFHSVE